MAINELVREYFRHEEFNTISRDEATSAYFVGMEIFDEPLIAYAAADDELFKVFKTDEEIMSGRFMHPQKWLPSAQTVVVIFFPFSERVKKSNMSDKSNPSLEWLHARFEGQKHINLLMKHVQSRLRLQGHECVIPILDERYEGSFVEDKKENCDFGGNWSERHAAYAAGLGTFGLSKGLITKKGVAGRFISLITDIKITPTQREYAGVYDYCINCGKCAENCPVEAISLQEGKQHRPCSDFLDEVRTRFSPRYGCGKCQVAVPCMDTAPGLAE